MEVVFSWNEETLRSKHTLYIIKFWISIVYILKIWKESTREKSTRLINVSFPKPWFTTNSFYNINYMVTQFNVHFFATCTSSYIRRKCHIEIFTKYSEAPIGIIHLSVIRLKPDLYNLLEQGRLHLSFLSFIFCRTLFCIS